MVLGMIQAKAWSCTKLPFSRLAKLHQTQLHCLYIAPERICAYGFFIHPLHSCIIRYDDSEHCWCRAKKRRPSRSRCGCKRMGRRQGPPRQTMPPSCIWRDLPPPSPWIPRALQTSLALTTTILQVSLTLQCRPYTQLEFHSCIDTN